MILRTCLIASLLLLGGCAPTLKYPPGQTLLGETPSNANWSASSARASYDLTWKTKRTQQRLHAQLRTLGSMGRIDLTTPAGTPLAQIRWDGETWQALFPASATLVEGRGDLVPLPMLGMAGFPYRELERMGRGVLFPSGLQDRPFTTLYVGKGSRVLLTTPDSTSHRWALHVDEKTGIVRRVQCFQGPVQESDLQIRSFLPGTLIPQKLRREFDTASVLELSCTGWSDRNFVSPTELALATTVELDTVSIDQDHLGRRFYTIRPSRPDSLPPFPADFLAQGIAPLDTSLQAEAEEDSLLEADSSEDSGPEIGEEDLAPEEDLPEPPPSLPAILREVPAPAAVPAAPTSAPEAPPAGDLAPPPAVGLPRRF